MGPSISWHKLALIAIARKLLLIATELVAQKPPLDACSSLTENTDATQRERKQGSDMPGLENRDDRRYSLTSTNMRSRTMTDSAIKIARTGRR